MSELDIQTIIEYERRALEFSERYEEWIPEQLYDWAKGFFHRGAPTADIGCGSGRDVAWLNKVGFPASGYDASERMLDIARTTHPDCQYSHSSLPDLNSIQSSSYANVLCSAVFMHLRREDMITAVMSIARILQAEGRMLLSYRGSCAESEREDDGRLFTAIPEGKLVLLLESAGFRVVDVHSQLDNTRPDIMWVVILAEKGQMDRSRGLERIQSILVQDAKTATYKLALVRAFCDIARTQMHLVFWGKKEVFVPMWPVAVSWLCSYWPIISAPQFIAQIRGETDSGAHPIAFRSAIQDLISKFGNQGLWACLKDLEIQPNAYKSHLEKIAQTIRVGPVTYAGTKRDPVFRFERNAPGSSQSTALHSALGWIVVPESIWLDISRFDHWIEDSVIMRWAALSTQMNPGSTLDQFLPYLVSKPGDERDTAEIRTLLLNDTEIHCVWTGRDLGKNFHVDHLIPYTVWGNNDLWNLLPCSDKVNLQKSDSLPRHELIRDRADCIVDYWRHYRERFSARFDLQIGRALGCTPGCFNWEIAALSGLQETVQKLSTVRGLRLWSPFSS